MSSIERGSGAMSLSLPKRSLRPAARRMPTIRTSFRRAQHVKDLAQLRAHGNVEPFSRWKASLEPAHVDVFQFARFGQAAQRRVHNAGELRIVPAIHESVGIVGQEIADDDERFL